MDVNRTCFVRTIWELMLGKGTARVFPRRADAIQEGDLDKYKEAEEIPVSRL